MGSLSWISSQEAEHGPAKSAHLTLPHLSPTACLQIKLQSSFKRQSLSYSLPQQRPTQRIFNSAPIQSVLAIKTTAVPASCYSHLSLTWEVWVASSRRKPCRYPALNPGLASVHSQLLKFPCWPLVEKHSLNWSPAMTEGK